MPKVTAEQAGKGCLYCGKRASTQYVPRNGKGRCLVCSPSCLSKLTYSLETGLYNQVDREGRIKQLKLFKDGK